MTTTIDRNVVEMVFDNRQFHKGLGDSLDDISLLKKALNFASSVTSFGRLNKAANNVKFGSIEQGIDSVNRKLGVLGVVAATAISNITTSVMKSAKDLFTKAIIDPLKGGMREYETQMNAVQTILSNTFSKGTTLEDVNAALDELNRYADLTIYNFTEMTNNIGKFTAAGIGLKDSVAAIKGIANLAAVSGSNSQQASTAMYQLSQALASGTVKLMDWNSVVNAGMGGQVFQDSLMETARIHGVAIDSFVKQDQGFRNTLQRGWLTSDILLETLQKFTGDLSAEQLRALGYTEEQIIEVQKLGEMANDAATKIKTVTQLMDTMDEAVESGWAVTWRTIFGDFNEARELFTSLGNTFGGLIEKTSEARNTTLHFWKAMGGRDVLIKAFNSGLDTAIHLAETFTSAFREIFPATTGLQLKRLTVSLYEFVKRFEMGSIATTQFRLIVKGLFAVLDVGRRLFLAILKPIQAYASTLLEGAGALGIMAAKIGLALIAFRDMTIETGILDTIVSEVVSRLERFGGGLAHLFGVAKDAISGIFPPITITKDQIIGLATGFLSFIDSIHISTRASETFGKVIKAIASVVDIVRMLFVAVLGPIFGFATSIETSSDGFYNLINNAADFIIQLRELIIENNTFTKAVANVIEFVRQLIDKFYEVRTKLQPLNESFRQLKEKFSNFGDLSDLIAVFDVFKAKPSDEITKVATSIGTLSGSVDNASEALNDFGSDVENMGPTIEKIKVFVKDVVTSLAEWFAEAALEIDFNTLLGAIGTGIIAALLLSIKKVLSAGFSGDWLGEIIDGVIGADSPIVKSITDAFGALEASFASFQANLNAGTLLKIAGAIGIVTASIIAISLLEPREVASSLAAVTGLMVGLFGSAGVMSKIDLTGAGKTSLILLAMSTSMLILGKAIRNLAELSPEQIATGLGAIAGGLTELLLAMRLIGGGSEGDLITKSILLQTLSSALVGFAGAVVEFGEIPTEKLIKGLSGVGIALTQLTVAMAIINATGNKGMFSAAIGIGVISIALIVMAEAVERFGTMELETMKNGLLGVGSALLGFAIFSKIVDGKQLLLGAIGIGVMSLAMLVLSETIKSLASLSWDDLLRSLAALGGALLLIVIATKLMSGSLMGAAAMIVVSAAVLILAKAMETLGNLGWDKLLVAMVGLAGVFVILGVAGLLLGPLVPVFMGIGASLALIGLAALAFGGGLALAAIGLTMLAASATAIAAGIGIVAGAIILILPEIGSAIAEGLANFILTIAEKIPELIEAGKVFILGLIQSIGLALPEIIIALFDAITAFLTALAERLPEFIQAGFDMLLAFLKGIADNIAEVVATGLLIVAEFINGVAAGLPDLVDAAFNMIITFIDALADAIDLYIPELAEALGRLGSAIIDGITQALIGGIERVVMAAKELGAAAIDAFKEAAGISSPSKKAYAAAGWIVTGVVNAINNGLPKVKEAGASLFESAQNGMGSVMEAIDEALYGDPRLTPTIRPVLEMGDIDHGLRNFDIDAYGFGREVSHRVYSGDRVRQEAEATSKGEGSEQIVYNQYITSPKALSTAEIYRHTKMQVARPHDRRKTKT